MHVTCDGNRSAEVSAHLVGSGSTEGLVLGRVASEKTQLSDAAIQLHADERPVRLTLHVAANQSTGTYTGLVHGPDRRVRGYVEVEIRQD